MKIYTNQKTQFENGETFRRLSRDSEIRYASFLDRPIQERQKRLLEAAREGRAEIVFVNTGIHIRLHFFPFALENVHGMIPPKEFCDFEKEPGKLWFRSPMIMNGVCCVCIGYVNLTKLDGTARLEFDADYARFEDIRCAGRTAPDPEEPNNNRSSSTSTSKTENTNNTGTGTPIEQNLHQGDINNSVQFADSQSPAAY